MKNLLFLTSTFLLITFFSCGLDEEVIDKNLSIKKLDSTSDLQLDTNIQQLNSNLRQRNDLVVVTWDWGRKRDCRRFGFCNVIWFPIASIEKAKDNKLATLLKFDNKNEKFYIDVVLDKPMPQNAPKALLSIPIDEKIVLDTKDVLGKDVVFNPGKYNFDKSLGSFGGYRVYLD
jgi:hypothetical protein